MTTKSGEFIDLLPVNLLPWEMAQKQTNLLEGFAEVQLPPNTASLSSKALDSMALIQALESLSQAAQLN